MKTNIKWLAGLIAAIVVVFIVAKLLNPFTSGPIGNKAKKAFSSNIEEVVEIIKEKMKKDKNFDATKITKKNIEKYLNISGDNFKSVKITIENDEVQIIIVGQNEWKDLVASGTLEETKVEKTEEYDKEAPVLTLKGDKALTVELGDTYIELGATAEDNKDGDLTNEIEISGTVDTSVIGEYTITYKVSDNIGNEVTKTRVINVIDTTIPTIALNGQSSITIEVGSTYKELGATAIDNSGDLTNDIEIIGTVNENKLGTYKVIYTVKDNRDNESAKTRTISVVDTTKPVLTLQGSKIVAIEVGSTYADAGATASDNYNGNITKNIQVLNTVNSNVLGQYTITYNVKDSSGNAAQTIARTVNVVDTTKPVITLNGSSLVNIEVGSLYNDLGVTVLDNYDGNISSNIETVSTLNTNVVGEYTITYNAKDKNGNTAITAVRVVNVVDTTNPVITLLGDEIITLEVGSAYSDAGSTAGDNYDGNLTADIVVVNNVNTEVLGTYIATYNVKDNNNNAATTVTRTINVVDTTDPVITLLGDENITLEVGSAYSDAGSTAGDNYDGNLTADIVVVNNVNTEVLGTYIVTYNVKDNNNNSATTVTRTINVVDTTDPVITLLGNETITLEVGSSYEDAGATALDNYDGNITEDIQIMNNVNTAVLGEYTVTYSVGDSSKNKSLSVVRTVNIVDTTDPVLTLLGDATVEEWALGKTYEDAGATASDNYDGDISANIETTSTVNINLEGEYTVTYNVSDSSGNEATAIVRTVNVVNLGNAPVLALGMTPIKWDGEAWVDTDVNDPEWYRYTATDKQWANARTDDSSMWVWIPRYIYKISSGWNTSTAGTINIQFSLGTNDNWNSTLIGDINADTTANASNNTWTNHLGFTFGDTELTGIWVAKFEASGATSLEIASKPNVRMMTAYVNVSSAFSVCRALETNSRYGWGISGSNIDTHLMKNVEWGAVAYLSKSVYGKNENQIWINPADNYTTGCAGDSEASTSTTGCLRTYETENGVKASTTGNIYGVYGMSGGAWEYVSAYVDNDYTTTDGLTVVNADDKYKEVYDAGTSDTRSLNYALTISKKGDAVYETSDTGENSTSWFNDFSRIPYSSTPWFLRGGGRGNTNGAGAFAFFESNGAAATNGFRPVLVVATGL